LLQANYGATVDKSANVPIYKIQVSGNISVDVRNAEKSCEVFEIVNHDKTVDCLGW